MCVTAHLRSESKREKLCQRHIISVALGSNDGSAELLLKKDVIPNSVVHEFSNLRCSLLYLCPRVDGLDC